MSLSARAQRGIRIHPRKMGMTHLIDASSLLILLKNPEPNQLGYKKQQHDKTRTQSPSTSKKTEQG
jgi:hypothetical protein